MNSSQFKKNEFKRLCAIIGSNPIELDYIIKHIDDYYTERLKPKKNEKTGEPKKYRDGTIKQRAIRPSKSRLKNLQSAIKDKILSPIILPKNIQGGVKKKSNISNAKAHQGNKFQFTTDLQEFYPNIKDRQIYNTFLKVGFSQHFSFFLTQLTTWKSELPQGTPTSTHIANLVFLVETDKKIIDLCNKNNIIYTRFVDDLTFSSQKDFHELIAPILEIVKNGDFKISYRKTKYAGRQTITGIKVLNNFIDAPDKIKARAKEEKPEENVKPYTNYLNRITKTNTPRSK